MKDNLYTQTVKNITAPKKLIDGTIHSIYGASKESEVISMKKNKHRTLKLTSAIAAALVLILTIGAIAYTGNNNNIEHPFILTVSASNEATFDEITKDTYVQVGEIKSFSDAVRAKHHAYIDENNKLVLIDNNQEILSLRKEFTIEMTCTGENIESVTYTAHNSCLAFKEDYAGLLSAVELTNEEVKQYRASGGTDYYKWASSCTYDYNCQPKSLWDSSVTGFEIPEDGVDGTIPLRMAFRFNFEEGKYELPGDEEFYVDTNQIFEKEFNAHADEFALDVTANFTDGTTSTKTLKFRCEQDGNFLYMYAIEV